jgi:acetyl esterase/lipase
MAMGIAGLLFQLLAIPAVVCGHLALSAIKRSQGRFGGSGLAVAGLVLGYFEVLMVAVVFAFFAHVITPPKAANGVGASTSNFDLSRAALPTFPELPDSAFQTLRKSGVRVAQVDFRSANSGRNVPPGSGMKIRVYLPPGEHAPHSLTCVLVAPAGTNMLVGNDLDDFDAIAYHAEALPYAQAGMVAVWYSLDGAHQEEAKGLTKGWATAYEAFRAAGAGTVNGRDALEFALRRLPMVDPARIFSAGHSSAGTVSLLLGAYEPRLRGSIAYAPATDLEKFHEQLLASSMSEILFPGIRDFERKASPKNQVARMQRPVFLFQAKDDSKVPLSTTERFVQQLRETNPRVTFQTVETGDHYDAMIDQGIPAGIRWLKEMTASN